MKINKEKIIIKKCNSLDLEDIYNIQSVTVNLFDAEEKGYYLPFEKEELNRILNSPLTDGKIFGAFYENKMVAWIFLSIHESIKDLLIHIPHIKGKTADIDGVLVHPDYRGNNLQTILVNHITEVAIEDSIDNILAEITLGNEYSMNNILNAGFIKEGEYIKNNTINRNLYIKKLKK